MVRVGVFLNSPYFGGAERSILSQVKLLKNAEVIFFIPSLVDDDYSDLYSGIRSKFGENVKIEIFQYPRLLFQLSRTGKVFGLFGALFGLLQLVFSLSKMNLARFDKIWLNGNKVGVPFLVFISFFNLRAKLIWHFRDYPTNSGIFKLVKIPLYFLARRKLQFIGNSISVGNAISEWTSNKYQVSAIYNTVDVIEVGKKEQSNGFSIGVVSMMAPWKGVHEVVLWSKLYENELSQIGVKSIKIFGGDLYKTSGEHTGYFQQIKLFAKKLDTKLISFEGLQEPSNIFPKIDLLIHSSLKPEPFGRVITEAFKYQVPVVSTAMGGANELILPDNGLKYKAYDHDGLFQSIKEILNNPQHRARIVENSLKRVHSIESDVEQKINNLLNSSNT